MEFISGIMWGAGVSLGLCVGLVTWVFLRQATYWLLGITIDSSEHRRFNRETLEALLERNALTQETNSRLGHIGVTIEELVDSQRSVKEK